MENLKCLKEIPLLTSGGLNFHCIVSDGCNFYILISEKCIVSRLDSDFKELGVFHTCREYSSVCYDTKEQCFWATSQKCYHHIFKLNHCFQEIDSILVFQEKEFGAVITGISYSFCDDTLLISTSREILKINKCNGNLESINCNCKAWNNGILSIFLGYIITSYKTGSQCISVYDNCGILLDDCCLPNEYHIKNIICIIENSNTHTLNLCVLASKIDCYPCILFVNVDISSPTNDSCKCQYSCDSYIGCCPCGNSQNTLTSTDIADTLYCEGTKLHNIICSTNDIQTILCANRSLNKVIQQMIVLEQTLYEKLISKNHCLS